MKLRSESQALSAINLGADAHEQKLNKFLN